MAKVKQLKTKQRKRKFEFQPLQIVKEELYNNGWENNTLSPLSTQTYWSMVRGAVKEDEKPLSIVFAKSSAMAIVRKTYIFIVTNKRVIERFKVADVISKPKTIKFSSIKGLKLFQDKYLPSRIYIELYLNRFKPLNLETDDPTSVLHFKKTLLDLKKGKFEINSEPEKSKND